MEKNMRLEKEADNIYRDILKNPKTYGITARGEILNNTGVTFVGSKPGDAKEAIKRLLGLVGASLPTGLTNFRNKIAADPVLFARINSLKSGQTGSGWVLSKAKKNSPRKKKSLAKVKKLSFVKGFKPMKWRVLN